MRAIIVDRILLPAAAFAALFALRCADLSGGGSEAGNARVIGRVMNVQGSPAGNVMVRVIPSDFDPVKGTTLPDSVLDTTGTDGRYGFTVQKGRTYTIQAVLITLRTRALVAGVAVGDTDITAPQCTLSAPGAVKVMLPDSADKTLGYIYVPGTSVFAFLKNASGFVVLDSVPAGIIPAIYCSSVAISASNVIRYDVPVDPGDTTVVYNPSWKYARRLFLNTTAGGADVSGNVYNFPVLARLTAGNFTFAQAQADGADIRFTKQDNTFLPCEIGRWDGAAGAAEIWVKVDTISGNDSMQYIMTYWGNPDAAVASSGPAVFDSSGGFEGVWHLNETSGTRAGDASHNGFSGTYRGGLPRGEPGPFGICQNLARPDSDYVDMGDVLNPGLRNISLGVWIKRGSFVTPQGLIAKTNGDLPSTAYGYLLSIDPANTLHFNMASGGAQWGDDSTFEVASNLAITDTTTWHYVLVAIDRSDNTLCKMYIDGIDRTGIRGGNIARVSSVANALSLHIGTERDRNCSFTGAIGEATVAFTVRSADWVQLSYMNQKERDALVQW